MVRPQSLDLEVSVSPIAAVRALRTVIQEAGWAMRRHEGARMVDRFAIIMPMTQAGLWPDAWTRGAWVYGGWAYAAWAHTWGMAP